MIRWTVAAIALVLLAVLPVAAAPPKVALTAIDNDDGGDLRAAVAEALEGPELTVVGAKATNRAVDNLKGELADLNEKQAKKLASDLEVDAIVHGRFEGADKKKILHFKLFVNGKKTKGFSVQFSNARSKKFKNALKEKMVEKISTAAPVADEPRDKGKKGKTPPAQADDDEDPKGKKTGKKGKEKVAKEEPDEKPTKAKTKKTDKPKPDNEAGEDDKSAKADTEDGEDADADAKPRKGKKTTAKVDGDEDEDEEMSVSVRAKPSKKGAHSANRAAVRLDVGGSASKRSLQFTSTPQLGDVGGEDKRPKPFNQKPVPGARFEIEMYPLAFGNPDSFAAGLGAAVEFDRVLKSTTTVQGGPDDGVRSNVKQQIFEIGGRYRLVFGKTATSPSVTLGVSYGRRTFQVKNNLMDRSNLDLPDTDYKYLAPVLGFRIPFTANVAFVANGEALLVRDAGPISDATSYGRAKVFGFDAGAGLDIVLGNRFAIRLVGEFNQIGYTFTGGGELAKNRDGDPTTPDIGGAADRTVGGAATIAVLY